MGEIIPIPLGPASDPARSKAAGDAVIINGFIEPSEAGKESYAIYGGPGVHPFAVLGTTTTIRGVFNLENKLYSVADESLYFVNGAGNETLLGTVVGSRPVITATNDKVTPQISIVADDHVYLLESDVLTTLVDEDLPSGVHSVAFMNGYSIYGLRDGTFYISAINDAGNIDALDFAEAEGSRDEGVRVFAFGLELWYFNATTTEVFYDTGNVDFPFERLAGSYMTVGCLSKYTPASFDNTMVWVTNDGLVVRSESYVPRRISTHAVERDIQRAMDSGRGSEIEAIVYAEGGHEFYQLSLHGTGGFTWVYDAATQLWHQKKSYLLDHSQITQYARCYNRHIVGSTATGKLGYLYADHHHEFDDPLILEIRSPTMHAGAQRITWNALYVDMDMGVGQGTTAPTVNPAVMISWSDDGGRNYSSERERPLGVNGKYQGRITVNRLGQSKRQGRIYKFRVSAGAEGLAVKKVVIAASADMDVNAA